MILITGGFGFLGSNLAESLVRKGNDVGLITRSANKVRNIANFKSGVKLYFGDVTHTGWIQRLILKREPEVIFHLAGQVTSYESFERPLYDVDVNAKSTVAILEAIRQLDKPCRFILGSTLWVIGHPDKIPINEETPCKPLNNYGANRLASEHYCQIYNAVYDLDTVVMRLSNTYGVKERHDNPKKAALNFMLYKGYKGETIQVYSQGKVARDYVYISDVVSAAEVIMKDGKAGELYFVGTGVKTWFYDIATWIKELTQCGVEFVEPPDFHKRIDIGDIVVDNTKMRSLGWDWGVPVKEGLAKTLEYYRRVGL